MQSRFQRELLGELGKYWKEAAENELIRVAEMIENGKIIIDSNGVARNEIGRVLMSDMLEKVAIVNNDVDVKATEAARLEEIHNFCEEYRRNHTQPTEEELAEARAEFGQNAAIVNILTGERYTL